MGANEIGGHAFNLGPLLSFPAVKVGVVYHAPLVSGYQLTRTARSNLAPPIDLRVGPDQGTIRLPRSLGAGVLWLPRPLPRLALDLTYDQWTGFVVDLGPAASNRLVNGFDDLPPELSATRNTVTMNAGLERLFPAGERVIPLRVGLTREPQGARDPILRENASHTVLAAGTGLNSNSLKLDLALEYRWGRFDQGIGINPIYRVGRAEELGLPLPPEAVGAVLFREVRLNISMSYRIARTR